MLRSDPSWMTNTIMHAEKVDLTGYKLTSSLESVTHRNSLRYVIGQLNT